MSAIGRDPKSGKRFASKRRRTSEAWCGTRTFDCFPYHSRATASKLFAALPSAVRLSALRCAPGSIRLSKSFRASSPLPRASLIDVSGYVPKDSRFSLPKAVFPPPPFAAGGLYFDIQAAAIPHAIRLVFGLRVADMLRGQRHGGIFLVTGALGRNVAPTCPRLSMDHLGRTGTIKPLLQREKRWELVSAGRYWTQTWRMGWDSNPRRTCALAGFQVRCIRPLCHPSGVICLQILARRLNFRYGAGMLAPGRRRSGND
jgi:hypothetical protein